MRWPKYWSFSFSIIPSNEHPGLISFRMDRLDLLAVQGTLKSLLQHYSSKASILQCSAFFTVRLSHPYMTTGKTIALTRWTFVGKVMIGHGNSSQLNLVGSQGLWGCKSSVSTAVTRLQHMPVGRGECSNSRGWVPTFPPPPSALLICCATQRGEHGAVGGCREEEGDEGEDGSAQGQQKQRSQAWRAGKGLCLRT